MRFHFHFSPFAFQFPMYCRSNVGALSVHSRYMKPFLCLRDGGVVGQSFSRCPHVMLPLLTNHQFSILNSQFPSVHHSAPQARLIPSFTFVFLAHRLQTALRASLSVGWVLVAILRVRGLRDTGIPSPFSLDTFVNLNKRQNDHRHNNKCKKCLQDEKLLKC